MLMDRLSLFREENFVFYFGFFHVLLHDFLHSPPCASVSTLVKVGRMILI